MVGVTFLNSKSCVPYRARAPAQELVLSLDEFGDEALALIGPLEFETYTTKP